MSTLFDWFDSVCQLTRLGSSFRTCEPGKFEYIQLFEKEVVRETRSYCNSTVIEIAEGRYDSQTDLVNKEFEFVPKTEPIAAIVKSYIREKHICDIGILTTKGHSKVRIKVLQIDENPYISML